jgi:hypothetical protein
MVQGRRVITSNLRSSDSRKLYYLKRKENLGWLGYGYGDMKEKGPYKK